MPTAGSIFIDAFAGTGVVAREAAVRGWAVRLNDNLYSSSLGSAASLLCSEHVPFRGLGGYHKALGELNAAPRLKGFIWREYSPASLGFAGIERRYFTEENAAAIDGLRARIRSWRTTNRISPLEECLLIGDLLLATNRVANTAGTFGCFLSHWSSNALQELSVQPRQLLERCVGVEVLNVDVLAVPARSTDVLYLDPPYTKRQYAAYYHLLETVAQGDEPTVDGVTGLRPWKQLASPFCYRRRALSAIDRVVRTTHAERIFLSYSSEGHVDLEALTQALTRHASVQVHELGGVGRYAPNAQARRAGLEVTEYLIEIVKNRPGED